MSSLLTNSAAMTALQTLSATNKQMDITQNRISTGYRVSDAADNAAYWSIATTMRSDNKALGAVQDALGLGAATVDVMYTALNSTVEVVSEIKAKVTAAAQPGVDRGKIQGEIDELQNQLQNIAASAVFNGENWLQFDSTDAGASADREIVSSFTRTATGAVSLETTTVEITGTQLIDTNAANAGILDEDRSATFTFTGASVTGTSLVDINVNAAAADGDFSADMEVAVGLVDAVLSDITDAATNLGAIKNRIGLQQDFVTALKDSIDRGVGQLVDADMNAESTRLQALQVQQQLGIQALSIANGNSQNILSLFR
ncbi:flagellin [Saliniramus sp.]|uniref:flagellin N-terminal helical domain-containing protein n=1 Tax=Saliniramus sp. TaxID=2986772 RepID=UPI002CC5CBF1|nr:flagellin [Saliniramus sp.]HMB10432.1 flagellin [Saliniramus sp.]